MKPYNFRSLSPAPIGGVSACPELQDVLLAYLHRAASVAGLTREVYHGV
jgi:hypothetical protein